MKVIYSPHHKGLKPYPLMEKPKWEDYQLGRNSKEYEEDLQGMKPSWQSIFNDNYHTKLAVYVKWLSEPPLAQVRDEDIEFFSVERGEGEYELLAEHNDKTGEVKSYALPIKAEKDDAFIQRHLERIKILTKEAKDSIQEHEYCNMCKDMRYCAENRICLQSKKEKDFEPSQVLLGDSVASHTCTETNLFNNKKQNMGYTIFPDGKYGEAVEDVYREVQRAKHLFKDNFVNQHEGYAVILEELDELWEEIKKNQKNYDIPAQRKEAVQCAAMLIRFIAELCPIELQKVKASVATEADSSNPV